MRNAVHLSATITVSSAAIVVFGSVVAQAASEPIVVGQKYSDAVGQLSSGLSVVVRRRWATALLGRTASSLGSKLGPRLRGEHKRLAGKPSASVTQLRCAGGLGDILWQLAGQS